MVRIPALLVEDEVAQATRARRILEPLGFVVETASTAKEARDIIQAAERRFDLIVLDRRLPFAQRDEPMDVVGDDLLEFVCVTSPDSLVIVLTGRADVRNVQTVMTARGEIRLNSDTSLDRVRHFEKTDYDGFEGYAGTIAGHIGELHDCSVQLLGGGAAADEIEVRLIAKVVKHVGGEAAIVEVLEGGLTGDCVYKLQVLDGSGSTVGRLIVKTRAKPRSAKRPTGNYHLVLHSAIVAMPFARVDGLARGREAQLIQDAGTSAESLFSLLGHSEERAVGILQTLMQTIDAHLEDAPRVIPIQELVRPVASWQKLHDLSLERDVQTVSASLRVHTSLSPQHGDFHGANVLVVDERPVLIDFDRERLGSKCLDPVTLLLSSLFHPASPVGGTDWMAAAPVDILGDSFLEECPFPEWFSVLLNWVRGTSKSDREVHALVLAYCLRQTSFPESGKRPMVVAWATAIAAASATQLAT